MSFLLTLLLFAPAMANDDPCREDVKKFCADVTPGGGKVIACMREHREHLSVACKAKIQERKNSKRSR